MLSIVKRSGILLREEWKCLDVNPFWDDDWSDDRSDLFESVIEIREFSGSWFKYLKKVETSSFEPNEFEAKPVTNKAKKGRKPCISGVTKRNDIILKSLIRTIKRFHWERFKKSTSFSTKNKSSHEKWRRHLHKYIEHEFGVEPNEHFIASLDAFLFMKEPRSQANNIFRDLFYSFSIAKLKNCMKDPFFNCLVYHYYYETSLNELNKDYKMGIQFILNL